ncbi:secretory pathway protein Sec39-domain-containing protein, partial [Chytriomyces sp. MP71]
MTVAEAESEPRAFLLPLHLDPPMTAPSETNAITRADSHKTCETDDEDVSTLAGSTKPITTLTPSARVLLSLQFDSSSSVSAPRRMPQLLLSECGNAAIMYSSDRIELRSRVKGSILFAPEPSLALPAPADPFPTLAPSASLSAYADTVLFAISASDGSIRLLAMHTVTKVAVPIAVIDPDLNVDHQDASLIAPLAALFFSTSTTEKYRLVSIKYSGTLRLYEIAKDDVLAALASATAASTAAASSSTFWRQAPRVGGCRQDVSPVCPVRMCHAVYIGDIVKTVSCANVLENTGHLVVAGLNASNEPCIRILEPLNDVPFWRPIGTSVDPSTPNPVIDFTANAADLLVPAPISIFDNGWDLFADATTHLFESMEARIRAQFSAVVICVSICPGTHSLVLTEHLDGSLGVWDVCTGEFSHRYTQGDLQNFRKSLVLPQNDKPSPNSDEVTVMKVLWWTSTSVALIWSDGLAVLTSIALTTPAIHAAFFDQPLQAAALPNSQLLILESNQRPGKQQEASHMNESPFLQTLTHPPTQSLAGLRRTLRRLKCNTPSAAPETRLTALLYATPLESVRMHVALGRHAQALALCKRWGMDADLVHKEAYLARPSAAGLDAVQDTAWVLRMCLEAPTPARGDTADTWVKHVRERLEVVVARTQGVTLKAVEAEVEALLAGVDAGAEGSVSMMDMAMHRVRAFKYLDRLDTFEALRECGVLPFPSFEPGVGQGSISEMYGQFRDVDLGIVAAWHAAMGHLKALNVLFTRHAKDVRPVRFAVLSHVPVVVDLTASGFLPMLGADGCEQEWGSPRPWRKPDWTETNMSFLGLLEEFSSGNAEETAQHVEGVPFPAPAERVTEWYLNRANEIERDLCNIDMALGLLTLASRQLCVPGLEALMNQLTTFRDILERADPHHTSALTLADVHAMPVEDVVALMLDPVRSRPDEFVARVQKSVAPFLARSGKGTEILDAYVLALAPKHATVCARLFQESRETNVAGGRAVEWPALLMAELILQCAYSMIPGENALDVLHNFRRSLPATFEEADLNITGDVDGWDDDFEGKSVESRPAQGSANLSAIRMRIALFESQLEALELLGKYGLTFSLSQFSSPEFESEMDKRLLVIRMARSLIPRQEETNDEDWTILANDLVYLLNLPLFESLDASSIMKEYLKGILQDGRLALARQLMISEKPVIDSAASESLVIECARELFDNANASDVLRGSLKIATDCLKVIPTTPATQAEASLIEATLQVYKLCSSLNVPAPLPIQIRLNANRLDIVSSLVYSSNSPKSIDMRVLLEIGRKLNGLEGLSAKQRKVDMSVRGIVANWALDRNDLKYAVKICEEMIGAVLSDTVRTGGAQGPTISLMQRSDDAWLICVRLLREGGEGLSPEFQQRLVGFVLERCEPGSMLEILDLIRRANIAEPLGHQRDLTTLSLADSMNVIHGKLTELPSSGNNLNGVIEPAHVFAGHDFYVHDVVQMGFRGVYALDGDVVKPTERRSLTELYLNVHFVYACKVAFERRRTSKRVSEDDEAGVTDLFLLSLAQEQYKSGQVDIAFATLLDVESLDMVEAFFSGLVPNRLNDLYAVYFLSIRTLQYLVPKSELGYVTLNLLKVAPMDLIKYIDSDHIRRLVAVSGMNSIVWQSRELAAYFSSRTKSSKHDQVLKAIFASTGCDVTEFMENELYKIRTLMVVARQFNNTGLLNEVLNVAEGFGVRPSILALEHLIWLLQSELVSPEVLQHGLTEFGGLVQNNELGSLLEIRATVAKGDVHKLLIYYSFLSRIFAKDEALVLRLQMRCMLIQYILADTFGFFDSHDLDVFVDINYSASPEAVVAYYADLARKNESLQALVSLKDVIPRFLELRFIEIFPDEARLVAKRNPLEVDIDELNSALFSPLACERLESVEFEDQDEDQIVKDFNEMSMIVDFLDAQTISLILEKFIVGEQAVFAPVKPRLALANMCIQVLEKKNSKDYEIVKIFQNALKHLGMIQDLAMLTDDVTGESIEPERVQQFDYAFGTDKFESLILCMKMVIAGTSPALLRDACQLLTARFEESAETNSFQASQVYADCVLVIIGIPRIVELTRAFRKNMETASDALDRLLEKLTGQNYSVEGNDAWDTDWDSTVSPSKELGDFVNKLKMKMRDTIIRVVEHEKALISPDLRLELIGFLQKYFAYEDIADEDIQSAKVDALVRNTWGFEVSGVETANASQFMDLFKKLLDLSSSESQCEALVDVLTSLSPEFLPDQQRKECIVGAAFVMAKLRSFELLLHLRFTYPQYFDLEDEARIIGTLKAFGSSAADEFVKHCLLSKTDHVASSCHEIALSLASKGSHSDRILGLLCVANGLTCKMTKSKLWPDVITALTSPVSSGSRFRANHESILTVAVLDLIVARQFSHAFDLVSRAFAFPTLLLGGVGVRVGILKGFLRRIASGNETAHEFYIASSKVYIGKVEEANMWQGMEEVMKMRSSGISEGERVLEALTQLESLSK